MTCAEKLILQFRSINSPVSRPASKIYRFRFSEIYDFSAPSRLDWRGVRVVTDVGRDAVDASGIN
jgi:hypothetical protein